jgi:hypothetical protein
MLGKNLTMDARWIIYGNDKGSVLSTMNYMHDFYGTGALK